MPSLKKRRGQLPRVSHCHNFAWSRSLWKDIMKRLFVVNIMLTVLYVSVAFAGARSDDLQGINLWYFIASSFTTASNPAIMWCRSVCEKKSQAKYRPTVYPSIARLSPYHSQPILTVFPFLS